MDALQRHGIVTAVTLHATKHHHLSRLRPVLAKADLCVCHRNEDIDRILQEGRLPNLALLRHGIPSPLPDREAIRATRHRAPGSFLIGCFGFLLPPKGIHQLIQAMALARRSNPLLKLNLLNALYPQPESEEYARQCLNIIEEKGPGWERVDHNTVS